MVKIIATNVWMYRENEFQWRLARVGQVFGSYSQCTDENLREAQRGIK